MNSSASDEVNLPTDVAVEIFDRFGSTLALVATRGHVGFSPSS